MATISYIFEGMKPCPFCGGQPVVKVGKTVFLDCRGCGTYKFVRGGLWNAKAEWNKRTKKRA